MEYTINQEINNYLNFKLYYNYKNQLLNTQIKTI